MSATSKRKTVPTGTHQAEIIAAVAQGDGLEITFRITFYDKQGCKGVKEVRWPYMGRTAGFPAIAARISHDDIAACQRGDATQEIADQLIGARVLVKIGTRSEYYPSWGHHYTYYDQVRAVYPDPDWQRPTPPGENSTIEVESDDDLDETDYLMYRNIFMDQMYS